MARNTERLEAEIAVKDNATDAMNNIIRSNQRLNTEMLRLRENMNRMRKTSQQRVQMKIETAQARQNVDKLKQSIDHVKTSATNAMSRLKTFGAVAGTAIAAGFGIAIKSGLELEKQMASMQHFIGVNNKGMNKKQVGQQADAYVKQMRDYATATPFGTNEVMSAGSRALGVAGGDTGQAMQLLKVAGDMSALTSGKSMMDALEALADAKTGEMERLKEFGFKVSAEQFKGFAGKGAKDNLNDAETNKAYSTLINQKLNPYFKGGAKKLGQTTAGKISTIQGNVQSGMTDAGTKMLESVNPKVLDKLVKASANLGNQIGKLGGKMINTFVKVSPHIKSMGKSIKTTFEKVAPHFKTIAKTVAVATSAIVAFKFAMTALNVIKPIVILMNAWRLGTLKATIAQMKLNGAMLLSPWTWVAIAIAAVVAAGVALYLNWDKVSKKAMKLWKDLRKWFGKIKDTTLETLQPVLNFFEKMGKKWDKFVQSVKDFKMPKIDIPGVDFGKPKFLGGNGFIKKEKKAIGGVIPRDNYPALLHEGEKVQTKQEVHQDNRKQGGNIYNIELNYNATRSTKQDARNLLNTIVRELEMAGGAGA